MLNRRDLLNRAAAAGAVTVLPFARRARAQGGDSFATDSASITIHPISHASFVMETPSGVIYADPVGGADAYAGHPEPDLILVTHQHGDHYEPETLSALMGENTRLLTNPAVGDMLPESLRGAASAIGNGQSAGFGDIGIDAIPAYNLTEGRLQYHPEGRDNGYVLTIDGLRVYIAGDTEGIPEMRALEGIGLAFVPMNLPYTMDVDQAADAVAEFAPDFVYPYHYRGNDPAEFARLLGETGAATDVRMGPWYS